jgi:acetolactate synthase I/III small subunit
MRTTFLVRVENTAGVLMRVVTLFHRLALNIDRLTFGPTDESNMSFVIITLDVEREQSLRIEAHLLKILPVLRVDVICDGRS